MSASYRRICRLLPLLVALSDRGWGLDPSSRISQYGHTAWRSADGIFDASPNVITQTSDGYLWLGTASSLLRFDGVRFVRWTGAGGVQLPSSNIRSLFTARDGSLWIGSDRGLSHWNNGVLVNLTSSYAAILGIVQDDSGTIWVARAQMLSPGGPLCRVEGNALHCLGAAEGVPFPYAGTVGSDHRGNIWVGSSSSYMRWSPSSQAVYAPALFKNLGDTQGIGTIVTAPNGNTLVGLLGGGPELGLEEIVDGVPKPYPVKGLDTTQIQVHSLLFDNHGSLWVGSSHGLYRIHGDAVDHYQESDGLSADSVFHLYEDREGDIWAVTSHGVDRFRDMPVRSFGRKEGLTNNSPTALLTSRDGALWISNAATIDVLQSGATISVHPENRLDREGGFGPNIQDHTGAFWISSDNQLLRYDKGVVRRITRPSGSPTETEVRGLAEDPNGDIWVTLEPIPDLWKVHNGEATRVTTEPALPRTYAIAFDHKGELWFGLVNGNIAHLRGKTLEIVPFRQANSAARIRQLRIAPDDAVLGATSAGLIYFKNGRKQILTMKNGLPCESILSFVFDNSGNLWMSSTCGMMEILRADWDQWQKDATAQVKAHVFDGMDGARYTSSILSSPAAAMTPDGRLWFANGRELQMVDPAALATNRVVPPVHIEEVTADGASIGTKNNIRIPALTRQIQFDYTAPSFSLPQKVLFRYRLDGHDKEWQEAGTRRQAFYNDLKPGTYRFHVIACNNDGIWNMVGSSIAFEVAPAWFQTRWFFVLCVIATMLLLYALYWLRIRRVRNMLRLRYDAQLAERTRLARDLHDTLLQTIQGTKIVAEQALRDQGDSALMRGTMERIVSWLSQAIIEGRAALTSLRNPSDTSDLAERLRYAAEECSLHHGIAVRFEVVGTPIALESNVLEDVYRIGYEAIRNACAHSNGRFLDIELTYGNGLRLRVKDDGVGIDPATASTGVTGHFGIPGMRERAARLKATLTVHSLPGSGTEVTLSINQD